jgi:hypothetical protein
MKDRTCVALRGGAFGLVLIGNIILANAPSRLNNDALVQGAPFLIAGFVLWLVGERASNERGDAMPASHHGMPGTAAPSIWVGLHPFRVVGILTGIILSLLALVLNSSNQFTPSGVLAWLGSIAVWWAALAQFERPQHNLEVGTGRALSLIVALFFILLIGAAFRLADLNGVPPEMTRDQAENVLDAKGILEGQTPVFFPNNTGREPLQMYATALLSLFSGLNFTPVRVLSAVEGLLTLLALWWLGREISGRENRAFGNGVGLMMAALVAVSYWHTALSRLGLRLALTPLFTALFVIYLARVMRDNRRNDTLKAGVMLGSGLYTYIAARLLPLVALAGLIIALARVARDRHERRRYALHFFILFLMAFVVFVPLFGYAIQEPDSFWGRVSSRLVGDEPQIIAPDVTPSMGIREAASAFIQNFGNALLMFNWKGDWGWVSGVPYQPALDAITGTLLILGLATGLSRLRRRQNAIEGLMLAGLLIMVIPSALALARPAENPSATRMSGALPFVYWLAALPLARLIQHTREAVPRPYRFILNSALVVIIGSVGIINADLYFNQYRASYARSSFPYRAAAQTIRQLATQTGGYGNVFVIGGPPSWIIQSVMAVEVEQLDWQNAIYDASYLAPILFVASQPYVQPRLNVNADIFFLYAVDDQLAADVLTRWFPDGTTETIYVAERNMEYVIYRVPAPGEAGFARFIEQQTKP